jgi:hypothetical protein
MVLAVGWMVPKICQGVGVLEMIVWLRPAEFYSQ